MQEAIDSMQANQQSWIKYNLKYTVSNWSLINKILNSKGFTYIAPLINVQIKTDISWIYKQILTL